MSAAIAATIIAATNRRRARPCNRCGHRSDAHRDERGKCATCDCTQLTTGDAHTEHPCRVCQRTVTANSAHYAIAAGASLIETANALATTDAVCSNECAQLAMALERPSGWRRRRR